MFRIALPLRQILPKQAENRINPVSSGRPERIPARNSALLCRYASCDSPFRGQGTRHIWLAPV